MPMYLYVLLLYTPILVSSITVKVTYHESIAAFDELEFHTSDTEICSRYNAYYVSRGFSTVKCRCQSGSIFYAGASDSYPTCKSENHGKAYGCQCRDLTCSNPLKNSEDTKTLLASWTFPNVQCIISTAKFSVNFWNGKDFERKSYTGDFQVTSDEHSSSTISLKWESAFYWYGKYEGRLIKFGIHCGIYDRCFVLKGIGSYTMTIADPGSSSSSSSNTTTIVIVAVLSIVGLIVIIIAIYVCWKKKYCQTKKRTPPPQQPVAQQNVAYQTNGGLTYDQQAHHHGVPPFPGTVPPPPYSGDGGGYANNNMQQPSQYTQIAPPNHVVYQQNQIPVPSVQVITTSGGNGIPGTQIITGTQPVAAVPQVIAQPYVIQQPMTGVPSAPQSTGSTLRQGLRTAGQVAGIINDVADVAEAAGNVAEFASLFS